MLAVISPGLLRAGQVTATYRFDQPEVIKIDREFSMLIMDNTIQAGMAGGPSFPFRGAAILLPPGEEVMSVNIEKRGWREISVDRRLYPRQHPVSGIEEGKDTRGLLINSSLYSRDRWIHPPRSEFTTQYLRGHSIAVGAFSPAGYNPAGGRAGYYRSVTVTVETAQGQDASRAAGMLRSDPGTVQRITTVVDNPDALSGYPGPHPLQGDGADDYEYLIITRDSLSGAFQPLKEFYTRRGMRTGIITVEDIQSSYSGVDIAEQVRNAIIDKYNDHGITHVLLGGDGDGVPASSGSVVPYRGLRCTVQSTSLVEDNNIPGDIYFSNLDGSWNDDGDLLWGEHGEEDFYHEVAVGRACVDNAAEVSVFISKTTMYLDSPPPGQMKRALMLGEHLFSDPLTYGGDELDQLIETCTSYGFTTTGIPAGFDTTTYYDRDMGSWSKTAVFDQFNSGTHWVSHAGHSNTGYVMRLYGSDITSTNFTNDGTSAAFPVVNSYGCYAGSFNSDECIGEKMVTIDHCAVAFLGNSRYGWFTEGTTNGPSHHFQREFFDAMFTEGITTLGSANQRSKDETVPFLDLPDEYEPGAHRWCFYCLNLLGDPALDCWTDTPRTLSVSHAQEIARDDTLMAVQASPEGATGSLYMNGTCYGRGVSNSQGHLYIQIHTGIPDSLDSMELNVSAHNHMIYRDTLAVAESTDSNQIASPLRMNQNVPNPFNPSTEIRFHLPEPSQVDIRAYDAGGRMVDRIFSGRMDGGSHTIQWTPSHLPSGVYFYVLKTGRIRISRKAVLIR